MKSSAARITAALLATPGAPYVDANVLSVTYGNWTIVWTVELTLAFATCGSGNVLSLFTVGGSSKVSAQIVLTSGYSCLEGGVDISLGAGSVPSTFLLANATPAVLATALNELLGATTAAEGVRVARIDDGPSVNASFMINFLGGGYKPLLHVASAASHPLLKRAYTADLSNSTTSADVGCGVERVAPGGIDLMPIPGRYLSAPTDQIAVRLRLASQTTARCAAPNWEAARLGCLNTQNRTTLTLDAYAGQPGSARTFPGGFSLERCALHCQGAADAVAFGAEVDVCTCFTAATLLSARSP